MKRYLASLGWVLLLIPFVSLAGSRAIGNSVSKARQSDYSNLPEFTGIGNSGSIRVFVTLGSTRTVRVEAKDDVKDDVEIKVKDRVLNISMKRRNGFSFNTGNIDVYVTTPTISSLAQSGSGKINVQGKIKSSNFSASVSGSGKINADVEVTNFSAQVSGSGRIEVLGTAVSSSFSVSGSGRLEASSLMSKNASANVSGSGVVALHAEQALSATLSGSGSIYYTGNPQVSSRKSGSGRIVKK